MHRKFKANTWYGVRDTPPPKVLAKIKQHRTNPVIFLSQQQTELVLCGKEENFLGDLTGSPVARFAFAIPLRHSE